MIILHIPFPPGDENDPDPFDDEEYDFDNEDFDDYE